MFIRFIVHSTAFFSLLLMAASCNQQTQNTNETVFTPEMQEKIEMIRSKTKEYVDDANKRDVNATVSLWSDQAVYKNPVTGELASGRDEIRSEIEKVFSKLKEKNATINVEVKTVRFPIEEKAVEEGVATISIPGQQPHQSPYRMIYVNENGDWFILHVSDLDFGLE